MKSGKLILASLVIFVAGIAAGSALSELRGKAHAKSAGERKEVPSPMSFRIDFLRRAQKELHLSEAQKSRIEGYLREGQDRLRALWEPVAPQARAEIDALRERIRGELDAEQQAIFDKTLRERSRRGENRDRRPEDGNKTSASDGDRKGSHGR